MSMLMQDVIVGVVVLGAVAVLVRRVLAFALPKSGTGCASCASNRPCAPASSPVSSPPAPIPLDALRSARR